LARHDRSLDSPGIQPRSPAVLSPPAACWPRRHGSSARCG